MVHEQGVHHNIRDRLDRTSVCRCLCQRFGSGKSIDDFPPERVMEPDDLVVASLRGLELGEAVCIPSLPDVADWHALEAAEAKIAPNASRDTVADRYRN